MIQRTPPQWKTDDAAFPIRLRLKSPERGFGNLLQELHDWLRDNVGRGNFAWHASGLYFCQIGDAFRFMKSFPQLELQDGTQCPTYYSPSKRLPRAS